MNKGRREEITKLKYRKRVKLYGFEWLALKSHGKPCSCEMCKADKYRDKDRQRNKKIEFD